MNNQYTAQIHIQNTRPIKIENIVAFFSAIQKEYNSSVGKDYQKHIQDSIPEIAISRIHSGSQIYELIIVSTLVLYPEILQYTIVDFFKYLQKFLQKFENEEVDDLGCSRKECRHAKNLTEIFEDDGKLSLEIETMKNRQTINKIEISNQQGRIVREKAIIKLQQLEAQHINNFENVLLQFYQTRNVSGSSPGDKAIIPSISDKPNKILFNDDNLKKSILEEDSNIFRNLYRVSGSVEYKGEKVQKYNIDKIETINGKNNEYTF
ncbi:MAG: hypothetical protein KH301_07640 [Brachyspira sp.]|nr:hypothetical protein [Brachyspira sp.]